MGLLSAGLCQSPVAHQFDTLLPWDLRRRMWSTRCFDVIMVNQHLPFAVSLSVCTPSTFLTINWSPVCPSIHWGVFEKSRRKWGLWGRWCVPLLYYFDKFCALKLSSCPKHTHYLHALFSPSIYVCFTFVSLLRRNNPKISFRSSEGVVKMALCSPSKTPAGVLDGNYSLRGQ